MSAPARPRAVLVLAADAAWRRALADPLRDDFRVREAALDPVPALDEAGAAVVALESDDLAGTLERLARLRKSAVAGHVVLVTRDLPEVGLEAALDALDPAHWMPDPPPAAALRRAVEHTVTGLPPAERVQRMRAAEARLVGVSESIRAVLAQIERVAPSEIAVLITGETGTGKELVARAIHERSRRAAGPYVAVNCGALPDTLLESELFGHQRGAFTGADRDKPGLFETARGGTLFLDEVGDTSAALQAKLLRVLEEKTVRALGATGERSVDVRIVSATHRDVAQRITDGRFRQDLYYRLAAVTMEVPPLRRRRVDIPLIAQHFAAEFGAAHARRITLSPDLLETLTRYRFPGNVRELRNAVERAIAMAAPGEEVSAAHLGLDVVPTAAPAREPAPGTLRERVERLEVELIRDALARFDGNRTRVAEALGLSRVGLRQKMRRLGLADAAGR